MSIYNRSGIFINKKSFTFDIAPDCHVISVSWDGKGLDGEVIDAGKYYVVFDLNESGAYVFNITAVNKIAPWDKVPFFKRIGKTLLNLFKRK
jgi:hypothetical protein